MSNTPSNAKTGLAPVDEERIRKLAANVQRRAPLDAYSILKTESDETVAAVLGRLTQTFATQVLLRFPKARQESIVPSVDTEMSEQWTFNQRFAEDRVGRLMSPPIGVFGPQTSVREAVDAIRELVQSALITYAYVVDGQQRLLGVVVMRDLLLASPDDKLGDVMVENPFFFHPDTGVNDAMQAVVHRHYPVYPVCDADGRLIGLVQGYLLFEQHAFEISAQPGRMVGVDREEHYSTPWSRCLQLRQPWLQLNLWTAFLAAATVGAFEGSIEKIVALAVFLPVLAGQAGNTGCQALAVTVRGLTLGEYGHEAMRTLLSKEALLGLWNGALVGVVAAGAMVVYASMTHTPHAWMLGLVVLMAMVGSCVTSGLAGVVVPLLLKRFGFDPASASGIFVTTATDIASMGMFLGCATALVM